MKLRPIKIRKMDKKGDFQSLVVMIGIVFALSLAVILFSKVFLAVTDELKNTGTFSDRSVDTIELVQDRTIPLLDFFIFFSLIGLIIGLIISSIYIDTHPAFAIIFIIALVVAVFIGGQLANVFDDVTADSTISATADEFVYTNLIFSNFGLIILVTDIIIVVVLFGKARNPGGTI